MVRAVALRRKGVLLRNVGRYDASCLALQEAKFCVEGCGLGGDQKKLETILDLAE